ncbi:hypothetical protein [Aliiroseovarius subalbicans]|uniref:hypothetical protein n=1 Tax=Aliiroseovarius subalbicans TaxID=2925840 RepID=UPI001F560737|nr:hypothetical protein [Aliiroseovarius subalbicans]MCI2399284.1 hypothetical protein [Aliiroseovarius subalbicans]
MALKKFAQINCSILRSKKMADCNHEERWAYLCAHLTPIGSYTGIFHYPLVLWAQDAGTAVDELHGVVNRLCEAGLVEYDHDEELLRIVGLHRQRPPENASRLVSMLGDLSNMETDSGSVARIWMNGVAELSVAAVKRAQSWIPDSAEWPKLREPLKAFLRQSYQEYADDFLEPFAAELKHAGKAGRAELVSIFPLLTELDRAPCRHPADTVAAHVDVDVDVDDTETNTKTETETKTKTKTPREFSETLTSDVSHAEGVEVLRNGAALDRGSPIPSPRESTKRSALVMGLKQQHS